ncbi:hypothetical protein LOAG_12324 [Loa loa]|uniref:BAR domain-containing protein n=1 Tax=Loa loa TaxID=7209 RepID=A0A1I7W1L3_LOALO|nr:hypothetical protein LOAG_12324 [Loa loa]EFO16185.1 hypothetical protein LOAG_12324 [Loa loa]
MPKTLTEIKKLSAYPDNFTKAIGFIKITQEYTVDVVAAIEKSINLPARKHSKPNDLERLAYVAQKYMPYFVSGTFYEALQATANVCISVAKQEREAQMEVFQRVVTPMKSWILEDYPRLMKDIKKCYYLKDKMDRSMASVEARKTPERLRRAEEAKNKHQSFFERVENEYQFERKAKDEFLAALTKCDAEINAGTAALKEAPKYSTVEEMELKESKKENGKESEKKKSQQINQKSDKPEQQKASKKQEKMEEQLASIKLEKPEKQTDKQETKKGEDENARKSVSGKGSNEIK